MNKKDTENIGKYLMNDNVDVIKKILGNEYNQILPLKEQYGKILDVIVSVLVHEFIVNLAESKDDVIKYKRGLNDLIFLINDSSEFVANEKQEIKKEKIIKF